MRARTNPRRPEAKSASERADDEAAEGESGATVTDIGPRRAAHQPTPAESKLDAFTGIIRGALKADDGAQAGVDTTILVRIDLQSLLSGLGTATIDGIETPISAAAARRLAAEADLIPQVFDGKSVLLDQGVSKRQFTRAQRYAILALFVGCGFPQRDIPSAMTEIHHVGRWATRHDHDDDHVPWFIPPATIDFRRKPVRGGNLRHESAA